MASLRICSLPLRAIRSPATATSPSTCLYQNSRRTTPRHTSTTRPHSTSSVSADEVSHFSSLASSWWDPMGPSRILHLMNPLRHEFIASCLVESPPPPTRDPNIPNAAKLHYLDIGCGGGIFAESLARTIPLDPSARAPTPTRAASMTTNHRSDDNTHPDRARARTHGSNKITSPSPSPPTSSSSSQPEAPSTTPQPPQYDIVTLFEVIEHIDYGNHQPANLPRKLPTHTQTWRLANRLHNLPHPPLLHPEPTHRRSALAHRRRAPRNTRVEQIRQPAGTAQVSGGGADAC
ncbi:hypothetical protein N7532_008953 [Penicillium argentinense]|uniref:Uncharacterized protein n=1 Tax=Penicillium argentinense TaxID=1131581 RepID=A0A9W9K230_9EURO|nr:uncharacterized protein N7532_008953 [Penicillium argentinense]KAJ5090269.1 hypothetical protein N7532_008953 [Penicillium argentinense]